jgi:hypothetical protein
MDCDNMVKAILTLGVFGLSITAMLLSSVMVGIWIAIIGCMFIW